MLRMPRCIKYTHTPRHQSFPPSLSLSLFLFLSALPNGCLLHSLLKDGVAPGLAYDEVSPLCYDDGDEKPCVASVLQLFPLTVALRGNL